MSTPAKIPGSHGTPPPPGPPHRRWLMGAAGLAVLVTIVIIGALRPDGEDQDDAKARAAFAARNNRPAEAPLPPDQASLQDLIKGYWTKTALIVDARDLTAFQSGHIYGALPSSDVTAILKAAGPQRKPIIVYGQDSADVSASRMANTLKALGLTSIRACNAGLKEWQANNGPVVNP